MDFHQVVEHNGIRFWSYNAGHVLGAAMFYIEIGGVRLLYTGDYSMEEDRHLMGAEIPSINPDVLIVESTFGIAEHGSREEREQRFTAAVEDIVSKQHGACLIPVFALGRAQELVMDAALTVPLSIRYEVDALSTKVQGFEANLLGKPKFLHVGLG